MGRTIWEEVPAHEISRGDVLQWGSDATFRVRVTEVYNSDPERVHDGRGNPARGVQVTGPTDRFEHLAGISTGRLYHPDAMVKRMRPAHAARVADTNLRTVIDDPAARQDAEIAALERRQALHYAQIMGEVRDRQNDVSDPIAAHAALARQLEPLYVARQARLGVDSDAGHQGRQAAEIGSLESGIESSTPESVRAAGADDTADDDGWERSGDVATWTAGGDFPVGPGPQTGRPPAMTYRPWWRTQGVDVGETEPGEHHWRCPVCRVWAGPYTDVMGCKRDGMNHRAETHDLPRECRSEARKAARKIGGAGMTAAVFDAMVRQASTTYDLPAMTVHLILTRIGSVHAGYNHADDLVDSIVGNGLTRARTATRQIVLDLAAELGCAGWLVRMGA